MKKNYDLLKLSMQDLFENAFAEKSYGLLYGKTGISIALYHYYNFKKDIAYRTLGDELLDDIYSGVSTSSGTDFANGLAGIGWGVEHLIQKKFIEGDADEILFNVDQLYFSLMFSARPEKIGLLQGVLGYGFYFLKRIQGLQANDKNIATLRCKHTLIKILEDIDIRLNKDTRIFNEPPEFSIFWDLPVLIFFLAEFYHANIYNVKVRKVINFLIKFLDEKVYNKNSNNLLLALSLTYLQKKTAIQVDLLESIYSKIKKLEIKKELTDRFSFDGFAGIAIFYKLLFRTTRDNSFKKEYNYWSLESNVALESLQKRLNVEQGKCLGISRGLGGYVLSSLL